MRHILMSLLPWVGLGALIWYTAACVVEDRKPRLLPAAALMAVTWLLAVWTEV